MGIEALSVREAIGRVPTANVSVNATGAASGQPATAASGRKLPAPVPIEVPDVHAAAARIDEFLRHSGKELAFSVDDVTGRTVVSVRDPSTGDLIRQIPSQEALRIARNLETEGSALIDAFA